MKELTMSEDVYSRKWLKEKLQEKYGESLFFATIDGGVDVVCFRDAAKYLINDQWYKNRQEDIEEEAKRIVKQAAKIILGQIRSTNVDTSEYPSNEVIRNVDMGKEWIPRYLQIFMEHLINNQLKQVSLGQAIVGAVKSRSCISPLMFGLGVESDKVFGSRWLLTELNRL